MKAKFLCLTIFGLMIVSFLVFRQMPAQMQSNRSGEPIDSPRINDKIFAESSSTKFEELIEKAERNVPARVIIGLRADFQIDGELSSSAQNRQRAAIKRAQNDLLADLSGFNVAGIKRFDFIPFLAAEIDASAL